MKNLIKSSLQLLLLVGLLFSSGKSHAIDKFKITLLAAPSLEWTYFRGFDEISRELNDFYGTKASYNFGFEFQGYFTPRFGLSFGIQYQNKGFRNETSYLVSGSATETDVGITIGSARFISIPVMLKGNIALSRRTFLSFSSGLWGGYLIKQTINNRNYNNEVGQGGIGYSLEDNGKSNTNIINDFAIGYQGGVGISRHVKSRVVVDVHPVYRYQLNKGFNNDANTTIITRAKLNSFAIEIKVGYYFSDQIDHKKKEI